VPPVGRREALIAASVVATMAVVLDRLSKDVAEAALAHGPRPFLPGLMDFLLTHNRGAAWGLFQGARPWFLAMAALAVLAVLGYLLSQPGHARLTVVGLGLFAGGSIGNAIDRALSGEVVDFLHLLFIEFPIFNVADSAISVGVGLLLLSMLLAGRAERRAGAAAAARAGAPPAAEAADPPSSPENPCQPGKGPADAGQ